MQLPKSPFKDILVIACGFLLLFLFLEKKGHVHISVPLLYGVISIVLLSLISKRIAEKIVWAWYKLAQGLGYVNSRILLTIIFYVFLTPIAILYRLSGKNTLQLTRKKEGSYYIDRNHQYEKKDLEKMW